MTPWDGRWFALLFRRRGTAPVPKQILASVLDSGKATLILVTKKKDKILQVLKRE